MSISPKFIRKFDVPNGLSTIISTWITNQVTVSNGCCSEVWIGFHPPSRVLFVMASETKIIYHIDEEETPYLVKLTIPPDQVTLADFKNVLNRPNYKFFFKSMDDDFGYDLRHLTELFTLSPVKVTRVFPFTITSVCLQCRQGRNCWWWSPPPLLQWKSDIMGKGTKIHRLKQLSPILIDVTLFLIISVGLCREQHIRFSLPVCREHRHNRWETSFPVIMQLSHFHVPVFASLIDLNCIIQPSPQQEYGRGVHHRHWNWVCHKLKAQW